MKLTNQKQAGFTLIELIIVIVILGILAVTAAPKFLNLQGDANASTLKGVDGAINSAMNIVYGKAIIDSKQNEADSDITVGADTIEIVYGYPEATADGIALVLDIDLANDFESEIDGTDFYIYAKGTNAPVLGAPKGTCYVKYSEAPSGGVATTEVEVEGC